MSQQLPKPKTDEKTVLVLGAVPTSVKKLFGSRTMFLTHEQFMQTSLTIPQTIGVVIQYGSDYPDVWGWCQSRRILQMRNTQSLPLTVALLKTFTTPAPKVSLA